GHAQGEWFGTATPARCATALRPFRRSIQFRRARSSRSSMGALSACSANDFDTTTRGEGHWTGIGYEARALQAPQQCTLELGQGRSIVHASECRVDDYFENRKDGRFPSTPLLLLCRAL